MMKYLLPSRCEVGILLAGQALNPVPPPAVGCLSPWRLFPISKEW